MYRTKPDIIRNNCAGDHTFVGVSASGLDLTQASASRGPQLTPAMSKICNYKK